jgi:hypothetical protein
MEEGGELGVGGWELGVMSWAQRACHRERSEGPPEKER